MTYNLDELEKLEKEATPGNWESIQEYKDWWRVVHKDESLDKYDDTVFDDGSAAGEYNQECNEQDRDFITALRNAAPELFADLRAREVTHNVLCDELRRLQSELAEALEPKS